MPAFSNAARYSDSYSSAKMSLNRWSYVLEMVSLVENHIEHGMDRLMADRTTFVIAHRLSTVRNANAIMVLEHGQIIERGDHEDLLAQKGRYFELYTGMKELE